MTGGDAQPALLNAFLLTTKDALMVFEAARRGICPVVTRRLHDGEKAKLIISGSVFAFDEQSTGIKRWTDGAIWSPSRIIGNYLIYRELDKKGEKEVARPSTQSGGASIVASPQGQPSDPFDATKDSVQNSSHTNSEGQPSNAIITGSTGLHRELERALVGSLTTSYRFKKDGLIKKTISNGHLHLISYYTIDDVLAGRLRTPSSLIELASLEISPALLDAKNFRMPPVTEKDIDGNLRYIGEESDPAGAPPILAPLLAPGSVPAARPLSAIADGPYASGPHGLGTFSAYDNSDPHPFAFKPLDDTVYHPSQIEPGGSSKQHQHPVIYTQRRPDTAQPLWSQRYAQDDPPIAGPSGWREQPLHLHTHHNPHPSMPPSGPSLHSSVELSAHDLEQEARPFLQRSYSGAPPHGEHPYYPGGYRPMTQFRRLSYRPPTSSSTPHYTRVSEPYTRPMAGRPATSPAPYPGMYGMANSFSSSRGLLSAKAEPESPAGQHPQSIPYQQPLQQHFNGATQYAPASPAASHNFYSGMPQTTHTATGPPAHLNSQQYPQSYNSPESVAHSAPSRPSSGFPYPEPISSHFHHPEYDSGTSAGPYQEAQSAPAYTETFRQRSSHSGPIRQHFGAKLEDPS